MLLADTFIGRQHRKVAFEVVKDLRLKSIWYDVRVLLSALSERKLTKSERYVKLQMKPSTRNNMRLGNVQSE